MATRVLQALPPLLLGICFCLRLVLVDTLPLGDDLPLMGVWGGILTGFCFLLAALSLARHSTGVLRVTAAVYVFLACWTYAFGIAILLFSRTAEAELVGWWASRNWISTGVALAVGGYFALGSWMILRITLPDRAAAAELANRYGTSYDQSVAYPSADQRGTSEER